MRSLRVLCTYTLVLLFLAIALYELLKNHGPTSSISAGTVSGKERDVKALFSFTAPVSLFPPSAIISLTDDNSTFFLARPAAFGPDLPEKGLSGPLWAGGGFTEDAMETVELGCNDVPGWEQEQHLLALSGKGKQRTNETMGTPSTSLVRRHPQSGIAGNIADNSDGTGNHLLPSNRTGQLVDHAELRPVEQNVTVVGRVALLKRGGCAFIEKVLWAQRRGALAVIIGDNVRGGPLVRMFAKGDAASNVSIPALFTSHTTAHLLSSLLPSGELSSLPSPQDAAPMKRIKGEIRAKRISKAVKDEETQDESDSALAQESVVSTQAPKSSQETEGQRNVDAHPPKKSKEHEGLWVTLSPAGMEGSPFLETLLVLVVSPLVTLTVVYALLILRSRIRRRRWRAPKSVVDRLPVRTYHTISDSDSTASATPATSSPTAPLLLHNAPEFTPHPPSRSRTASEPPAASSSCRRATVATEEEKREARLAEWRRRYGGRQKECVVCLEEYVDGVSRVMSLPCGHEFHAECITPWLVTRRRTCPICKGDVVRDLSRSYRNRNRARDRNSPSPTRTSRFTGQDVDDIQAQAAETRNDMPSSSRPVPTGSALYSDDAGDDVEANWTDDTAEEGDSRNSDAHQEFVNLGSSARDLGTSVATVIWRGVDAVRGAAGFPRRHSRDDEVDRDR
ncbi:uncharacterized protein EI97DRAFT_444066 [Westerdykella ornata]|uniref:RING-type E3 ubiquitin transferase n=1 Tax=Westerdykella ornata TaxID=318751 RepID=A0A6A6JEF5_WESOR|nr:uncharacterized protein EI97DRAFT_444066 [Westerdykella ornata]KAF2274604.1 hypothetical protein EI97DRAFT_444066 [Westerdykella ornata]